MHSAEAEPSRVPFGGGVDLADQLVAVQDRQGPVAEPALRLRLVHLELVVELEQLRHPLAVENQAVERGQQRDATRERLVVEVGRIDAPGASDAVDDRFLADVADVVALAGGDRRARARDAERPKPTLATDAVGVSECDRDFVGIDPFGEVPQFVAACLAGDRDLTTLHHHVEETAHVAVVVPAARLPRHQGGVGQVAGGARTLVVKLGQDVAPGVVVGIDPAGKRDLPVLELVCTRPDRHLGAVEGQVLGWSQHRVQLHEGAVGHQVVQQ